MVPLKRQLFLAGIPLTSFELLASIWPLWALLGFEDLNQPLVAVVAIPCYLGALAVWAGSYNHWLQPISKLLTQRRNVGKADEEVIIGAARMMARIPVYIIGHRFFLWLFFSLLAGALWYWLGVVDSWYWVHDFVAVATMHGYVVACIRAIVTAMILRRLRNRTFPGEQLNMRLVEGYQYRFRLVGMSVAGGFVAAFLMFLYFFIPVSQEAYRKIAALSVFWLLGGTVIRILIDTKVTQRLDTFLASEKLIESASATVTPQEAFSLLRFIPARLAMVQAFVLSAFIACSVVYLRTVFAADFDTTLMITSVGGILIFGAYMYENLAHRQKTATLMTYLTAAYRFSRIANERVLSLWKKLIFAVGGVVLFACLLSFLWAIAQYQNLSSNFVDKQAALGLKVANLAIQREVTRSETPPTSVHVVKALSELYEERRGATVYLYSEKPGAYLWQFGKIGAVPWYFTAEMLTEEKGSIRLPQADISGHHAHVSVTWQDQPYKLGYFAVLHPESALATGQTGKPFQELLFFFLILVVACGGIVVLVVTQVSQPVAQLQNQAKRLADGDLNSPVRSAADTDEIGQLTFAMEEMRQTLAQKLRTSQEQAEALETAVAERTHDLAAKNHELAKALDSLTAARSQLVRSEKLASIGQLVAGIAHEINNPVNALVNTVGPLAETVDELAEKAEGVQELATDAAAMLGVIHRGAERTKAIVSALHGYARTDERKAIVFDLNTSLRNTVELARHSLRSDSKIELKQEGILRIEGRAGQLSQVFLNLVTNALQVLEQKKDGVLTISSRKFDATYVEVIFADNGSGMTEDVIRKIFDPFFTTKDVGEGTGLGLSIVHNIIESHGGTITVNSRPGEGTSFTVLLPHVQPRDNMTD